MPHARERFLQKIESLFRTQHAHGANDQRTARPGLEIARRRRMEHGRVDAVVAKLDARPQQVFVVHHVPAHGLTIYDDGVHNLVRPAHLAPRARIEQRAMPQRAG